MILALFLVAALAYGAASFAYGADVDDGEGRLAAVRKRGRLLLIIAALAHLLLIGLQCVDGDHPLKNIFLATNFGSLVAVAGYLMLSRGHHLEPIGIVLAPFGLAGIALGVVFSGIAVTTTLPKGSGVATAHVVFATAGLAGFMLAAAVAGLYLVTERRLRNKRFRPGSKTMSLTGLDRLHHRLVLLVTPIFTLAIVTGVLWIVQAGGPDRIGSRSFEIAAAVAAWGASVTLLVSRAIRGSQGRRSAWLTIFAFVAVLLIVVSYGVRE